MLRTGAVRRAAAAPDLLKRFRRQWTLQAVALLGVAWMIIFNFIPMFGIMLAFRDYRITKPISAAPWVGLKFFIAFFRDPKMPAVFANTVGISALKLLIGFPLPIVFALLLNELRSQKYKKAVQTISYLPHFVSWVILGGFMITWLSNTGFINQILMTLGIIREPIYYLAEPTYFWGLATVSEVWKELGWNAIIYLAAIAGINPELYEAATVDGANRLQKAIHVSLPCIRGTIAILFILAVSYLMSSNFDQIFVLKNQLNAPASDVLDIYVYRMGIQSARYSYSTAIGLFKSLISLALLLAANTVSRRLAGSSIF